MHKNVSVLVVDDDASQIRTMSLILRRKGYEVATACDGFEAIEKVEKETFDIILIDIKMPVMNGVDAYKKIKKIQPGSVVIMMTAYAVEDLIQEALKQGAYSVLHKPLDMDQVTSLIGEALKERNGGFILIVDDDESICVTLKNILMRKGYVAGVAYTGEEAISLAKKKKAKVIILDMKLPTINGLETYLAIKEITPETVAIMITAYRHELGELVDQALKSSVYTCLNKPIDMEMLLGLIDGIIRKK